MSGHADWITRAELIELTGWNVSTITRRQSSGALRSRELTKGRNGKSIREYDASSLPAEFQAKRLQQKLSSSPLVLVKSSEHPVPKLPAPDSAQVMLSLTALTGKEKDQAEQRLQAIVPLIDFTNQSNGTKPIYKVAGQNLEISSLGGLVKHLAATLPYSERTLWNWWNAYKAAGPGGLVDRPRKDKDQSRFFALHKEAAAFAANKFLNERLSISMVHEALLREWPRLQLHPADPPPVYETVRGYLNSLSPIISAIARQGETVYNNEFAPFLLRDISKVRVNQYWISDHMTHDVFVRNIHHETGKPVFNGIATNEAFRPWLTCIVDMRSRRVVGCVWCVTPSSNTINSALRSALRTYGMCEVFYIDNGKDYKKLGKKAPELSADAQGVLVRLGIRSQHCLPKHPQSKQIESFFRTVHKQFDVLWTDAYCGTSSATRPDSCSALLHEHKKLMTAGSGNNSPLPTASEFIQAAEYWMQYVFNASFKCSGRGMNGKTPQAIYDEELPPQKRTGVNLADVAQLFWDRQKRIVSEGGCVQLYNARYEPADAESAAMLMMQIKREIHVACDPLNVGEAIALTMEGKFLGNLRAQELLIHGETSAEQISASMRARRKVFSVTKRYLGTLQQLRAQAGDSTELEILQRRAAMNAAPLHIHTMPALQVAAAVNDSSSRHHVDDIADSYREEEI